MTKPNPKNEIIKREYFRYLREAGGRDSATIDCVAKSLTRFEESTNRRDFKRFHREQAVAFKASYRWHLEATVRTGNELTTVPIPGEYRTTATAGAYGKDWSWDWAHKPEHLVPFGSI